MAEMSQEMIDWLIDWKELILLLTLKVELQFCIVPFGDQSSEEMGFDEAH